MEQREENSNVPDNCGANSYELIKTSRLSGALHCDSGDALPRPIRWLDEE
jgi:hypothetical protein